MTHQELPRAKYNKGCGYDLISRMFILKMLILFCKLFMLFSIWRLSKRVELKELYVQFTKIKVMLIIQISIEELLF